MYKRVSAAYFSGTGTTEKTVKAIAKKIADELCLKYEEWDFTPLFARQEPKKFEKTDIVIFGTPVIAGRVPNLLLKYLDTLQGNGAIAVPVVMFGNRSFDDALIELRDILEKAGMTTFAAAGCVGEHSFSRILGKGRPDSDDMEEILAFAKKVSEKIKSGDIKSPVKVDGVAFPYRGYYQPRDRFENPIDIRKVKPKTNDKCDDCKLCAKLCPLGSIDFYDVSKINGICMKCCACVKKCPKGAKYFDDEGYLYHQHELEEVYIRRAKNKFYLED